jgi:hypothetical protein
MLRLLCHWRLLLPFRSWRLLLFRSWRLLLFHWVQLHPFRLLRLHHLVRLGSRGCGTGLTSLELPLLFQWPLLRPLHLLPIPVSPT